MGTLPTLTVLLDDGSGSFPFDISRFVMALDGYDITRGRDDWQGASTAGQLTLTLNNSDGRFTPGNTTIGGGGYGFGLGGFGGGGFGGGLGYSVIRVDQKIRVKETIGGVTFTRFTGFVKSWPVSWPATVSTFATVMVTATDAQARAERRTLRSIAIEEVLASGPRAYYTLGETDTATAAGDLSGNGEAPLLPVMLGGATYAFGADLGLIDGSTGVSINNNSSPAGAFLSKAGNAGGFPAPATWTSPSACMTVVFRQSGFNSALATPLAGIHIGSGSGSYAITFDATGHALFNGCTSPTVLTDGLPHVITVQAGNGLSTDMWVDGVKVSTAATMTATWDNGFVTLFGQSVTNAVTTWGHFSYGARVSDAQVTSIHKALTAGLSGESGTARITRLAGYAGVAVGSLDTSLTNVTAQSLDGGSAQDAIQQVTDAELGITYIDGTGALTFHNRNRVVAKTSPDLILSSQWITPDVAPVLDDQRILNYLEVTAQGTGATASVFNAASQTSHGRYPDAHTYLVQTDAEAFDRGSWIISKFAEPTPRYGTLTINLYGMPDAQAAAVLTALDMDCWLRITSMASQNPGGTVADVVVQGWRETATAESWFITCNVVSQSLYAGTFVLDSSALDGAAVLYV